MAIPAQHIIRRCVDTLQDSTSVRWPVAELVRYLNDGQREIVLHRPDAGLSSATITCVAGTKQAIPPNGSKLIEVVRNAKPGGTFRAVRMINKEILDAQIPNWHTAAPQDEVLHFMYDVRDPKVFYVYPPATTSTRLDITYSAYPTDIAEPPDGATYTAVTGDISVSDIYANALQDYILYRAYMKDSEYAGNAQRAQAHYAAFVNALGVEVKATVAVAPNPVGNPNRQPVNVQA